MSLDVSAARAATPACQRVHHLNNAGASPSPTPVLDVVTSHLVRESEIGGYEAADEARDRLESVYGSVATLVGGDPDEVALVENATRAWDMAFYGLNFRAGDRILTGRAEYASNAIALLQVAERTGALVEVIEDDEFGQVDVERLSNAIDERVKLISVCHVPTNGGLVNPIEAVGEVATAADVPYFVDACQSVGQVPVDVDSIRCDVLTATGRKFLRGPRGTGFAWVRRTFTERIDPPLLDLHSARWTSPSSYEVRPDARRLENWESNVAARLGLGAAIDYASQWGIESISERVFSLAADLRARLGSIQSVRVHDKGERLCGIVSFSIAGVPATEAVSQLRAGAVNTSVSPMDYAQFDLPHRGLGDLVRASVHYFNDDTDLDRLCTIVDSLAQSPGRAEKKTAQ